MVQQLLNPVSTGMSSCRDEVLETLLILKERINAAGTDGLSNPTDLTRIINTYLESLEIFHIEYSSG